MFFYNKKIEKKYLDGINIMNYKLLLKKINNTLKNMNVKDKNFKIIVSYLNQEKRKGKSWTKIYEDLKFSNNNLRIGFNNFQNCKTITNGIYSFTLGMSGFEEDDIEVLKEWCAL